MLTVRWRHLDCVGPHDGVPRVVAERVGADVDDGGLLGQEVTKVGGEATAKALQVGVSS